MCLPRVYTVNEKSIPYSETIDPKSHPNRRFQGEHTASCLNLTTRRDGDACARREALQRSLFELQGRSLVRLEFSGEPRRLVLRQWTPQHLSTS